MGIHEQHYPPQPIPWITGLLVDVPVSTVHNVDAVKSMYL